MYVYICIYGYMDTCIYGYMYTCTYVYMDMCIYGYMYICIYVYMYICIYVYMYICIYVVDVKNYQNVLFWCSVSMFCFVLFSVFSPLSSPSVIHFLCVFHPFSTLVGPAWGAAQLKYFGGLQADLKTGNSLAPTFVERF